MYKICTLVGTRPEIIKLSVLIKKLDKYFKHTLIHSGQNYDYHLNKIFFDELKLKKPDYFLNVKSEDLGKTLGNIITKTENILKKIKPDAILVYGDTNTSLGIISAKRLKIPIFHMEAGNRCFDQRVPEELNRKIADHLSDINITISEHARQNLISEGINREFIFKFGSHMNEVIEFYKKDISKSKILEKNNLEKNKYLIISLHREENVDDINRLSKIIKQIENIKLKINLRILLSTHPRTMKKLKKFKINSKKIEFLKPFGFFDYCKLQQNSYSVISDSGTIFEESSILNFPAVTIRESHERMEGAEGGVVTISADTGQEIINSIKISRKIKDNTNLKVNDYHATNVSEKIINIIQSYIPIINQKVWKK
jgi:UDP-N-acetylglucosamine 2-epimerase (non-hydrolysing)